MPMSPIGCWAPGLSKSRSWVSAIWPLRVPTAAISALDGSGHHDMHLGSRSPHAVETTSKVWPPSGGREDWEAEATCSRTPEEATVAHTPGMCGFARRPRDGCMATPQPGRNASRQAGGGDGGCGPVECRLGLPAQVRRRLRWSLCPTRNPAARVRVALCRGACWNRARLPPAPDRRLRALDTRRSQAGRMPRRSRSKAKADGAAGTNPVRLEASLPARASLEVCIPRGTNA